MWKRKVPILSLKKAISFTLEKEWGKVNKEISVALVPSEKMMELNFKFRGKSSTTDVLAFSFGNDIGPADKLLGEIVICPDVALSYAKEKGHSLEDELVLLAVHGTLHLLGYEDEKREDRDLMIKKEREILRLLGKKEYIV